MLNETRPTLNLQLEQRLNLGSYEHVTVSVGLSRLPFDAPEALIEQALDTADLAVAKIRDHVRNRIALLRMEDRYPAPVLVRPEAFAPADPQEPEPSEDDPEWPFPGPYTPMPAADWGEVGRAIGRLENAEYSVVSQNTQPPTWLVNDEGDSHGTFDFEGLIDFATRFGRSHGEEPPAPPAPAAEDAPGRFGRAIPDEDDVVADVEVFGIRLPLVREEDWRRPLTGQIDNTDQMLALNAGLTSAGFGGTLRHRAVEAIANAYLRTFLEAPHEELLIVTLRDVPFAAAHLVLTWLEAACTGSPLPLSLLSRAVSRASGQPFFDSELL